MYVNHRSARGSRRRSSTLHCWGCIRDGSSIWSYRPYAEVGAIVARVCTSGDRERCARATVPCVRPLLCHCSLLGEMASRALAESEGEGSAVDCLDWDWGVTVTPIALLLLILPTMLPILRRTTMMTTRMTPTMTNRFNFFRCLIALQHNEIIVISYYCSTPLRTSWYTL